MPKRFHLNRPDLAQAVADALADTTDVTAQQRLLAMRLAASGQLTAAQIAAQIGISRRQFFHWVRALKAGGVEQLPRRGHGGGPPAQVQGGLLAEMQVGLREGRWKRAKEIQQWLAQRHRTTMGLSGVYYWLGKLGGVLKVPRQTHAHKNAVAASEFQQTLCTKLKSLTVAGGKRVRVWVADEHRYGLIPVVRRCWTLRGLRPTAPYQTKYEWGYLYSAWGVCGRVSLFTGRELGVERFVSGTTGGAGSRRRACGHLGSSRLSSATAVTPRAGARASDRLTAL